VNNVLSSLQIRSELGIENKLTSQRPLVIEGIPGLRRIQTLRAYVSLQVSSVEARGGRDLHIQSGLKHHAANQTVQRVS
jgi:hypothetical protein